METNRNTGTGVTSIKKMLWHNVEAQTWKKWKLVMTLYSELTIEYQWENHRKLLYYLSREKERNNIPQKQITLFEEMRGRLISQDNTLALCKHDEIEAAAKTEYNFELPGIHKESPCRASSSISDSWIRLFIVRYLNVAVYLCVVCLKSCRWRMTCPMTFQAL